MGLEASQKYRNSEKGRLNRQLNATKINEQVKVWKTANRERKRALDKAYHERNKANPEYLARRRHNEANRRARRLQATPGWLTPEHKEQIKQLYINCPPDHHVDHVIPLKGNSVSGLHVPWNLQWLPGIVNRVKSNKVNNGY